MARRKSMKPGGGGRFAKCVERTGSPAICASAGRKKYGAKQMAEWSAAGRKRAASWWRRNPVARRSNGTSVLANLKEIAFERGQQYCQSYRPTKPKEKLRSALAEAFGRYRVGGDYSDDFQSALLAAIRAKLAGKSSLSESERTRIHTFQDNWDNRLQSAEVKKAYRTAFTQGWDACYKDSFKRDARTRDLAKPGRKSTDAELEHRAKRARGQFMVYVSVTRGGKQRYYTWHQGKYFPIAAADVERAQELGLVELEAKDKAPTGLSVNPSGSPTTEWMGWPLTYKRVAQLKSGDIIKTTGGLWRVDSAGRAQKAKRGSSTVKPIRATKLDNKTGEPLKRYDSYTRPTQNDIAVVTGPRGGQEQEHERATNPRISPGYDRSTSVLKIVQDLGWHETNNYGSGDSHYLTVEFPFEDPTGDLSGETFVIRTSDHAQPLSAETGGKYQYHHEQHERPAISFHPGGPRVSKKAIVDAAIKAWKKLYKDIHGKAAPKSSYTLTKDKGPITFGAFDKKTNKLVWSYPWVSSVEIARDKIHEDFLDAYGVRAARDPKRYYIAQVGGNKRAKGPKYPVVEGRTNPKDGWRKAPDMTSHKVAAPVKGRFYAALGWEMASWGRSDYQTKRWGETSTGKPRKMPDQGFEDIAQAKAPLMGMSVADVKARLKDAYNKAFHAPLKMNPKGRRAASSTRATSSARRAYRTNPANSAAAVFEEFTGDTSTGEIIIETPVHHHKHTALIGPLVELKVKTLSGYSADLHFTYRKNPIYVSVDEDKRQLFLDGGDQRLDLRKLHMNGKWERDLMIIGEIHLLTYYAEKKFDSFDPTEYFHKLGEETKKRPSLLYDNRSGLMSIVGGQYKVTAAGIEN